MGRILPPLPGASHKTNQHKENRLMTAEQVAAWVECWSRDRHDTERAEHLTELVVFQERDRDHYYPHTNDGAER